MVKIKKMLLTPNSYSRPQRGISVNGIVWHWVANPNTSAEANRNFFESRKSGGSGYGSAHYIIDLDGSVIQCLPDNEMGYHVGSNTYTSSALRELGSYPNGTSIGIECTHVDWNGKMTEATRKALIELTAELCKKHGLTANDVWTHQEVVGWKDCHRWYVNNVSDYTVDKGAVGRILNGKEVSISKPKPVDRNDIVMVESDSKGMYEIKKGDTFWGISQAFDVTVEELEKLNPNVNPSKLSIGQKVKIKEVPDKEYINLPASEDSWRVYPLSATPVKGNEVGFLNPKKFGGLKYQVLGEQSQDVYIIKTEDFGKVKLYGHPSTGATFSGKSTVKKSKPAKTKPKNVSIGRVKGDVWLHKTADFSSSSRSKVLKTGESYKVYGTKNGMYDLGSGFVSTKYIDIVGKENDYDLPHVTLRRGSRGSNVVKVQRALNKLNFKCGKEDGVYGATTENAVKRFQMVHDAYHVTGVYNSRVESRMESLLK
jgi:N-acetylmuramoyl-L-alanine amidase CwlA